MVTTNASQTAPRYDARRYFTFTFGFTFACWGFGAVLSHRETPPWMYTTCMLAGLVTPFVVSWAMLGRRAGNGSRRDFVRRTLDPRLIELRTLPALLLMMPLSVVVAAGLSLLLGGSTAQFRLAEHFSFHSGAIPVLLLLLLAAVFEELGWRGYGFESLRQGRSFVSTTVLFGVLWSLWHLPLVFVQGSYQYEILRQHPWHAVNFFVSIVPMGVIISWIYERNRHSVLAAVAFHFVTNLAQEAFQITQTTKSIQTVVLIVVAAALVIHDRERFVATRETGDAFA